MKPTVTLIQDHLIKNLKAELKKELPKRFKKGDKVCIKLHMGEYGNLNYLRPPIAGAVVEVLKSIGAKPFLFDSPVAYPGSRDTAAKYHDTARRNGFTEETAGCPIVISDKGKPVKSKYYNGLEVCKDLVEADGLLVLSHFKGHGLANWGGAIKNLGMGAIPIKSKILLHSSWKPKVDLEKCTGCGICVKTCPEKLISIRNGKAYIRACFACGACILACPNKALGGDLVPLGQGLVEATHHVLSSFEKKKLFFVNVLLDIANTCDCEPIGESEPKLNPACPNLGIALSDDPVALDKASLDLVNKATHGKFGNLWPADENLQIKYGAKFGLGKKEYTLKNVNRH